jgi:hypothetical protein
VLQYCESGLETHWTGIFFLTAATIAEMTMDPLEEVTRALEDLERAGLLHWDQRNCVIWVPGVCADQYRWEGYLESSDHKAQEGRAHIARLPASVLVGAFLNAWPIFKPAAGFPRGTYETPSGLEPRTSEAEAFPPVSPLRRPGHPDLTEPAGKNAVRSGDAMAREDIDWLVLKILSAMTAEEFDSIRARIAGISILDFEQMSSTAKERLQNAIQALLRALDAALEEKQKH